MTCSIQLIIFFQWVVNVCNMDSDWLAEAYLQLVYSLHNVKAKPDNTSRCSPQGRLSNGSGCEFFLFNSCESSLTPYLRNRDYFLHLALLTKALFKCWVLEKVKQQTCYYKKNNSAKLQRRRRPHDPGQCVTVKSSSRVAHAWLWN